MARHRRTQDRYGKKARRDGFPARSVYKLEEIDRRVRLLRPGMRVLDLGSSPGSWSLYAAQKVGAKGYVLGLDLKPPTTELPPNAEHRVLDAFAADPAELDGPYDVVLSDMAPSTTGKRDLDQYRSYDLFVRAIAVADAVGLEGAAFVGKIFQGPDFEEARAALRERYTKMRIIRPSAVRKESYEVFLIGTGKKLGPTPLPAPEAEAEGWSPTKDTGLE